MSRKDYVVIANVLRIQWNRIQRENPAVCPECDQKKDYHLHLPASQCEGCKAPQDHHEFHDYEIREQERFRDMVSDFCVELKRDNSAFNESRFRKAIFGE